MLGAINHATEDLQRRLLLLQIWFLRSTIPRRIYSKDYCFSKYDFYGQPCHGEFTAKITASPNMVFTVNHATEHLQRRLLLHQIWFLRSTMPRRIYSEDYWYSKYGFTINHATEHLQHRILDFSKYCSLPREDGRSQGKNTSEEAPWIVTSIFVHVADHRSMPHVWCLLLRTRWHRLRRDIPIRRRCAVSSEAEQQCWLQAQIL